jgi:hypothetical protein
VWPYLAGERVNSTWQGMNSTWQTVRVVPASSMKKLLCGLWSHRLPELHDDYLLVLVGTTSTMLCKGKDCRLCKWYQLVMSRKERWSGF